MRESQHNITILIITLLCGLSAYGQEVDENLPYWIFFRDKEVTDQASFNPTEHEFPHLSQRALDRRALLGTISGPSYGDVPVSAVYIDEILGPDVKIRTVSKWLNAVSIMAPPEYIEELSGNSLITKTKRIHKVSKRVIKRNTRDDEVYLTDQDYGASFDQNEQINAVAAHELGYTGTDIWLLMLDTGFYTNHLAFQQERIVAEYDFIQGDSITSNQEGDPSHQHNHGTSTASAAAGFIDSEFRGTAYECKLLLAKTEMVNEEIEAEEDFFVAALEWGEALGADIASSSLGYLAWYTYEDDLDGETAITTRGVDYAVSLGMVVVTAAGNEGNTDWEHIIAPADADSVISVGAVDALNVVPSFSSRGPTADGRIKPEVLARGVATYLAGTDSTNDFISGSGTSFATPLVAGACALVLEAHPSWTPMMVREALMMTADGNTSPDNTRGFGLIDVMAAINYDFGIVAGDVSNDDELNVSDAVLLLEWVLSDTELTEIQFEVADINNDLQVDILDIVVLVEWILTL
ncbi:MAG: S8 family serine peptidase [Candidatus Marinimicrobia bacterium]|nr:S8 family serine peptidase [Candidatus Neomarinimicrobiota bacterium]